MDMKKSVKDKDRLLFESCKTEGVLAFNPYEQILTESTFSVSSSKATAPSARNTFQIEIIKKVFANEEISYGDTFRLSCDFNGRKLYLQSQPVSPMRSSKLSREQEVSVTEQCLNNSIWTFETFDPKYRVESVGKPLKTEERLLIKHTGTNQWLASAKLVDFNQFGAEYEVFAKSYLSTNKTHNLYAEKVGHRSVENPMRQQSDENAWILKQIF